MKLTWLGHACFLAEQDDYKILIDPYVNVDGYADVQAEAHEVLCSHQHFDHNAVDGVTLLEKRESPFVIRTVQTCHDDREGALRGMNLIHILSAGGVTVAHLGDLGHQLSDEQLAAIGKVDGVMIPVGGTYTVDAAGAKQVCNAVAPRWVVPMHYRHGTYGFPVLTTVEDFLNHWDTKQVHRVPSAELEVTTETDGVCILTYGA